MSERSPWLRLLVPAVVLSLQAPFFSAVAGGPTAGLNGVIRNADRTPLAGARLLAADPSTATVHRSEPTPADGNFSLEGLAPGTYELAVEVEGGVYLVRDRVDLVAGVNRPVQIAVGVSADGKPSAAGSVEGPGMWDNPITASALVLGLAIVVGVIVKNATEDEPNASN